MDWVKSYSQSVDAADRKDKHYNMFGIILSSYFKI